MADEEDDLQIEALTEADKEGTVVSEVEAEGMTLVRLRAEYGDSKVHEMLGQMRLDMTEGTPESESAINHGWTVEVVRLLRDAVIFQEKLIVRRTPEETFIDYALRQEACVRELNELIPYLKASEKSIGAAVTAIKTKSDILERVLKMGQDLDLITKAPKRHELTKVDGIDVSGLSDPALRQLTMRVLGRFQKLVSKYGDVGEVEVAPPQDPHLSREIPANRVLAGRGVDRAKAGRVSARTALIERVKGTSTPSGGET
jgi:hypothetical protein